ncbi:MAG TPA: DUF4199 domain-containing protein [Chitinophagaceae bacterium]|nr:DUF4199 domain-containing protein [Chitinophagaceae bacterium]
MKFKLTPALFGLFAGLLMVAIFLFGYANRNNTKLPIEILATLAFSAGIILSVLMYKNTDDSRVKFWDKFNVGFRSFIVSILVMVAFTYVFNKLHPEFKEESAAMEKTRIISTEKSKTPTEIEQYIADYKKGYITALVSKTIFGYLIIGAIVTAITAAITSRRN